MLRSPNARKGLQLGLAILMISFVALAPVAAAASFPLMGEWNWGANWGTLFAALALIAAVALVPAGAAAVRRIPVLGTFVAGGAAIVLVVAMLAAAMVNTGGFLNGDSKATASFTPDILDTPTGTSTTFNAALHEPTSDVTFYSSNAATRSSINAAIKIYKPGVPEKTAVEGSATPEYSGTASSGKLELTGIQVQTLGCTVDVLYSLTSYYHFLARDQNICRAKNALATNKVSLPTVYLQEVGTLSLSKTDTSLTCTAGSQCSYVITLRNSATDKYLHRAAAKFANVANATLDSVDSGANCELVEISSTKYLVYTGPAATIGSLGVVTCPVKITRSAGSADGSFTLTADDNFNYLGSSGWNTNSNVAGATATSATTVSFA